MTSEGKIINDPVSGFISIPDGLLLDIVQHPLMQRLRRIKQLGLSSIVYPSALHSRFMHSLGAYHLMTEAIATLTAKGVFVFDGEAEAAEAAILMHDIGHGPFSHVLENTLISGISHEEISLLMMEKVNREMNGRLDLALKIFRNDYPKHFLHQLISSQLDMDRLDYLRRDSFYTGVAEGNIGSARIIKMLDVADDELVINAKGIYSIENYLMARRSMYWQVYLHKTAVAGEKMLVNTLLRAKQLAREGRVVYAPPALKYFLDNDVDAARFTSDAEAQHRYAALDDSDVYSALKVWVDSDDEILSLLASSLVNRHIFKVEVSGQPFDDECVESLRRRLVAATGVKYDDIHYIVSVDMIHKDMYDIDNDHISILHKDGTVRDFAMSSELFNNGLLSKKICKYYLCYLRI